MIEHVRELEVEGFVFERLVNYGSLLRSQVEDTAPSRFPSSRTPRHVLGLQPPGRHGPQQKALWNGYGGGFVALNVGRIMQRLGLCDPSLGFSIFF